MPKIIYIQSDGSTREVNVEEGQSLMEAAVSNGVKGIEAECGGACSCGTCHAYIDESFWGVVGGACDDESDMLEFADNIKPNSRLSCQVSVTSDMDGMVITIPPSE